MSMYETRKTIENLNEAPPTAARFAPDSRTPKTGSTGTMTIGASGILLSARNITENESHALANVPRLAPPSAPSPADTRRSRGPLSNVTAAGIVFHVPRPTSTASAGGTSASTGGRNRSAAATIGTAAIAAVRRRAAPVPETREAAAPAPADEKKLTPA